MVEAAGVEPTASGSAEQESHVPSRNLLMERELYVRWRPQRDSNPCYQLERLVTAMGGNRRSVARDAVPELIGVIDSARLPRRCPVYWTTESGRWRFAFRTRADTGRSGGNAA